MAMRILATLFLTSTILAQSTGEMKVLESVEGMLREGGRVTFSELYNSPDFSPEERLFLGRLYEIFFQLPGFLKSEFQSTGSIPRRSEIAASFGITQQSVDLLLAVMEGDPRMPRIFTRESPGGEISSLNVETIEGFIRARGDQVRVTQWEGRPLPSFRLETFDDTTVADGDLHGKNALIYFWFTGCPPCVRISPLLAELDRLYGGPNFQIVGFNADRVLEIPAGDADRKNHLTRHDIRFVNAHLDRSTLAAFGNVNVYPTLFFVQADGKIHKHLINFQDFETLERHVLLLKGE